MNITPQKILLVKNRGMGDSIMGLAAIRYLRQLFPQAHLLYGVPAWVAPLFQNTQTPADEIVPLSLQTLAQLAHTWKSLSAHAPEAIFELHLAGRTYKLLRALSWWRKIPYHYHNHHLKTGSLIQDQGVIKPLIQRDLDGLWSYWGQSSSPPSFLDFSPQLQVVNCTPVKAAGPSPIIFGVVATRPAKMWPLEYFVQLAQLLHDKEIIIPLSGSKTDQEIKNFLAPRLSANCRLLEVPLAQLPAQLASASWYVGNDTGLKHLALALGVRTYTLFGPEPPLEWHPYDPERHPYRFIEQMPCRTLTGHFCGRYQCPELYCLKQTTPAMVFQDLRRLLDGNESLGMMKIGPDIGVE